MSIRQEILNIPEALRETLEKGRSEYESVIRQTRWGTGPVFMIGSGSSYVVTLTGALAFESVLGLPVVARRVVDFRTYSTRAVERRSVLLVVSQSGESDEVLEAARAAPRRGAVILALTGSAANTLAKLADSVFLVRSPEDVGPRTRTVVCQQAAISLIGVLGARIIKRPDPQVEAIEEELRKLPAETEWILTQFQDAARSLASRLRSAKSLTVVASGFYSPPALQWALLLEKLCKTRVGCFTMEEFRSRALGALERGSAVVLLSGSRSKLKGAALELARGCRTRGAEVFSVTDSADRELAETSSMAMLVPTLGEIAGSILALSLLDWVAYELSLS